MPRTSRALGCVVNDGPHTRLSAPDAVVVIVITVLAGVLSRTGMDTSSILAVLGGAALVASGTLLALRSTQPCLGPLLMRTAHAIPAL